MNNNTIPITPWQEGPIPKPWMQNPMPGPIVSIPTFPDGSLHITRGSLFSDAILDVHEQTKAPLPLILNSALSASAIACQGVINVEKPLGGISPVSLINISIASSGERKTTVDKLFMEPIYRFESEQIEKQEKASHEQE